MNTLEFHDLGEDFDAGLLEQAYRDVYLPAFPLRDEQEDPTIWTPRLLNPEGNPRLCFLVAGTRLDTPGAHAVRGLLVAEYYAASQCVLISYVATHPDARGQGLARRLFDVLGRRLDSGRFSRGQPVQAVLPKSTIRRRTIRMAMCSIHTRGCASWQSSADCASPSTISSHPSGRASRPPAACG